MTTEYVHRDGTKVAPGHCVVPDHWETTFVVKVRSLQPVSPDQLRNLIQSKHEVTALTQTHAKCVVRN